MKQYGLRQYGLRQYGLRQFHGADTSTTTAVVASGPGGVVGRRKHRKSFERPGNRDDILLFLLSEISATI